MEGQNGSGVKVYQEQDDAPPGREGNGLPKRFLKVPEVCEILRPSRAAVYALMAEGRLTFHQFGRSRRVSEGALRDYLANTEVKAK
jgi:excisionase family DNA binding protein